MGQYNESDLAQAITASQEVERKAELSPKQISVPRDVVVLDFIQTTLGDLQLRLGGDGLKMDGFGTLLLGVENLAVAHKSNPTLAVNSVLRYLGEYAVTQEFNLLWESDKNEFNNLISIVEQSRIWSTQLRCDVIAKLGDGESADVYLAHHSSLGLLAVKNFKNDTHVEEKIWHEVEVNAKLTDLLGILNAPRLVYANDRYIIFKFAQNGEAISKYVEDGNVSLAERLELITRIAEIEDKKIKAGVLDIDCGLDYLVLPNGNILPFDFGAASFLNKEGKLTHLEVGDRVSYGPGEVKNPILTFFSGMKEGIGYRDEEICRRAVAYNVVFLLTKTLGLDSLYNEQAQQLDFGSLLLSILNSDDNSIPIIDEEVFVGKIKAKFSVDEVQARLTYDQLKEVVAALTEPIRTVDSTRFDRTVVDVIKQVINPLLTPNES